MAGAYQEPAMPVPMSARRPSGSHIPTQLPSAAGVALRRVKLRPSRELARRMSTAWQGSSGGRCEQPREWGHCSSQPALCFQHVMVHL